MKTEEPIRVLNVVPNMAAAGIESFIMNVYRNIDTNKVQFDFLVHNIEKKFYDDEILKMGGKIYRLNYKNDKNFIKYLVDLNKFFKTHKEYKIIHGHMQSMMPIYLFFAKKYKIPVRIAHSHNNSYEKSLKGFLLHILSRFSKFFSTQNFACSIDAGRYMFKNKKFEVINNGINSRKFEYNETYRKKIRSELKIDEDTILIGNIGRLEKQKNQSFLINAFFKAKQEKNNIKLLIIGAGELEHKLRKQAEELDLMNDIIFFKNIKNINEYMCAMDAFLLPSLYEGLGIVLIEAQNNGLHCYTTKGTVAKETYISNKIDYLDLNENIWADTIKKLHIEDRNVKIFNNDFDIKNVADKIENKYIDYIKKMGEKNER